MTEPFLEDPSQKLNMHITPGIGATLSGKKEKKFYKSKMSDLLYTYDHLIP